jgi:hypothetical protein
METVTSFLVALVAVTGIVVIAVVLLWAFLGRVKPVYYMSKAPLSPGWIIAYIIVIILGAILIIANRVHLLATP